MTDIEIPDNKHAALELEDIANPMDRRGSSGWAYICRGAARRLRADAEEIARLEAKVDRLSLCLRDTTDRLSARSAELASASVDAGKSSRDPLTRIAAALERPSREWVATQILSATLANPRCDWSVEQRHSRVLFARYEADALLAEMGGEG